ncbi:hypothetical protein, partial [Chromobacterium piscinae]|uniref:hypothetical protein n=1 Tax=Chromobacterium piscinae TaxID=686831 RepID=UPI0032608592
LARLIQQGARRLPLSGLHRGPGLRQCFRQLRVGDAALGSAVARLPGLPIAGRRVGVTALFLAQATQALQILRLIAIAAG